MFRALFCYTDCNNVILLHIFHRVIHMVPSNGQLIENIKYEDRLKPNKTYACD